MKFKSILGMTAVLCFGLLLMAGGCARRNRTEVKAVTTTADKSGGAEAGTQATPGEQAALSFEAKDEEGIDLAEKEEIRRKYTLKPGALVNVHNINGGLKIETADASAAEVLVVRSAKTREELTQYRQVMIEQEENSLTIRVESDRKSIFSAFGKIPEGHQRVVLKLPRKVDLDVQGVGGAVAIGEIQGRVELRNINGQLKAGRIAGETQISGVNGGVDVSFAPLTGKRIELNGINGNMDLRFEGEVNADLTTWGLNGQVNSDLPGLENKDDEGSRGRAKARIGAGGTQIRIGGANGNLNLLKAEKAATKVAAK